MPWTASALPSQDPLPVLLLLLHPPLLADLPADQTEWLEAQLVGRGNTGVDQAVAATLQHTTSVKVKVLQLKIQQIHVIYQFLSCAAMLQRDLATGGVSM